jgi:thiol-disulfide isomerase/thioredoxin
MLRLLVCVLTACVVGVSGLAAAAADELTGIRLGDVCPDWKELPGVDGRKWSRSDFVEKPVLVLCFTCNSCPYSVDYEDRLLAFAKKYCGEGGKVALVAVNANRKPSETLEKMGERAKAKGFGFPYVMDETQGLAAACGAVYTPEFFVFNHERKLIFKGAMDDRTNAAEVQVRHLENAVEAGLKKEVPVVQEVPARGCAIPYRRARR